MTNPKQKVAILGGGISSLTTAFELAVQGRYDITVYQMGWRLGGKGASGRNLEIANRIEEHGLHIWFGFYENAFELMGRCYQEVQHTSEVTNGHFEPFPSVRAAFTGQDSFVLADKKDGQWALPPWLISLPGDDRYFPGEPSADGKTTVFPSPWEYALRLLEFVEGHFREHLHQPIMEAKLSRAVQPRDSWIGRLWASIVTRLGLDRFFRKAAGVAEEGAAELLQEALKVARSLDMNATGHTTGHHTLLARLLREFKNWLNNELDGLGKEHLALRRAWILVDLGLTSTIGMLEDGVLLRGFDILNDMTFKEWLAKHDASQSAIDSPPVQALHDAAFAYEDGDTGKPNMAAGVALRAVLRIIFTYKGHVFFKMNAGMGDVIFAPLYLVLKHYGVKFKFFHRVEQVRLSPDQKLISEIDLVRQVDLADGRTDEDYEPLIKVGGLPCWPYRPDQSQIIQDLRQTPENPRGVNLESRWAEWTDAGKATLRLGKDFDLVVLGLSLGPISEVCRDLVQASEKWHQAVAKLKTVKTQSLQVWFKPDDSSTGWPVRSGIVGSYGEPYASWADFDQLQGRETWPPSLPQESVFYCCNVLKEDGPIPAPSDHAYPQRQLETAKGEAMAQLTSDTRFLWPRITTSAGGLDWDQLTAPEQLKGPDRATDFQYFRANVDPWERYVLSIAGAESSRISSEDCGFDNLFPVGTWTDNGFNLSSIEAAVMSGMKAARAISGSPVRIVGESDLPD